MAHHHDLHEMPHCLPGYRLVPSQNVGYKTPAEMVANPTPKERAGVWWKRHNVHALWILMTSMCLSLTHGSMLLLESQWIWGAALLFWGVCLSVSVALVVLGSFRR